MAGTRRDDRGRGALSLVEILLAVVIISLSSLPLLHFILSSKRGITISHQELVGTNLASSLVKRLKALPYAQVPLSREAAFQPQARWGKESFRFASDLEPGREGPQFTFEGVAPCPTGFERWLWIEEQAVDPAVDARAKVKIIRIRVTWKKAARGDGKVEVCTCVASPI